MFGNKKMETNDLKPLPDPEVCQTAFVARLESVAISECLVKPPYRCTHAVPLGNRNLCCHPDRRKFERSVRPVPSRP